MFRLGILSWIEIQYYLRSNQVIKNHQRSNLSQNCQKRVKSGCVVQLLYNIGPYKTSREKLLPNRVQKFEKIVLKKWNICSIWLIIHNSLHMSHFDYDVIIFIWRNYNVIMTLSLIYHYVIGENNRSMVNSTK